MDLGGVTGCLERGWGDPRPFRSAQPYANRAHFGSLSTDFDGLGRGHGGSGEGLGRPKYKKNDANAVCHVLSVKKMQQKASCFLDPKSNLLFSTILA